MCIYCVKCCVSPVEISVIDSVVDPSLGGKVCILLLLCVNLCCDLKDAAKSITSPTVLSEVRRVIEVPQDGMEGIEVSVML